jgi:NADPH:quinone reductase-like Zn-dependent oxidoreductase
MKAVLLKGHGGFEQLEYRDDVLVAAPDVFGRLVGYIERGEIKPLLAGVHPLAAIVLAQQEFLAKGRMGKIILVP